MTQSQPTVPIISGWNRIIFDDLLIPSDRMLIQLLRPDIDPASATLEWYETNESNSI